MFRIKRFERMPRISVKGVSDLEEFSVGGNNGRNRRRCFFYDRRLGRKCRGFYFLRAGDIDETVHKRDGRDFRRWVGSWFRLWFGGGFRSASWRRLGCFRRHLWSWRRLNRRRFRSWFRERVNNMQGGIGRRIKGLLRT